MGSGVRGRVLSSSPLTKLFSDVNGTSNWKNTYLAQILPEWLIDNNYMA